MSSHRNQKRTEFENGINVQWIQASSLEKFDMRVAIGLLLAMVLILTVYETHRGALRHADAWEYLDYISQEKGEKEKDQ